MILGSIPVKKIKKNNNKQKPINRSKIDFIALASINTIILMLVNLFNVDWSYVLTSSQVNIFNKSAFVVFDTTMLFCALFILLFILSWGSKLLNNFFCGILIIISSFIAYFKIFFQIRPNYDNIMATFEASFEELTNFINLGSVLFVITVYIILIFIKYRIMRKYVIYLDGKINLYDPANLRVSFVARLYRKISPIILILSIILLFIASIYAKFFTLHRYIIKNVNKNSVSTIAFRHCYTKHYLLQGLVSTTDYIINSIKYNKYANKENIFVDAKYNSAEPIIAVFVLGESARTDNWQLYGYNRNNNDNLMQIKNSNSLYNFKATACKSSTLPAMSCILSGDDVASYDMENHNKSSIFSAFSTVKFRNVLITPNNVSIMRYWFSELQYIDKFVSFSDFNAHMKNRFILDENIFEYVYQEIDSNNRQNEMIMVQMRGSHGNYCHRYPEDYDRFKPVCCGFNPAVCDHQELLNAYDNTIVYTDHILSSLMNKLKDKNAFIVYVSDHGESLGEGGYFGHGNESDNIPDEQLRVPLFVWFSDKYKQINPNLAEAMRLNYIEKSGERIDQSFAVHTILGCANLSSHSINQKKNLCYREITTEQVITPIQNNDAQIQAIKNVDNDVKNSPIVPNSVVKKTEDKSKKMTNDVRKKKGNKKNSSKNTKDKKNHKSKKL